MRKLFYLGQWFLRARLFGRKAPLQTVLFISDICNLRCKHCSVYELKNPHNMTYEQVRRHLQMSYDAGSRFVDFEGGEVTIWKDGDKRINDLIDLAKEIGFFSCTITTNAQLPFSGSHADSIWVSLDGAGKFHEEVRGEGTFAKLEKNIAAYIGAAGCVCLNSQTACAEMALRVWAFSEREAVKSSIMPASPPP